MKFAAIAIAALLIPIAADQAEAQVTVCVGGGCGVQVQAAAPAPIMYQPRVVYQPYRHVGTTVSEIRYPTPIRNWWRGRYAVQYQYAPVQSQCQNGNCQPQPQQ